MRSNIIKKCLKRQQMWIDTSSYDSDMFLPLIWGLFSYNWAIEKMRNLFKSKLLVYYFSYLKTKNYGETKRECWNWKNMFQRNQDNEIVKILHYQNIYQC